MTLAPDALGPTICVGEILVEIVATTVGEGFTEPQALVGPFPSGAPAIFVDQCGRFGGAAAMVGVVGDDDFGRINTQRLARDGVDISAVTVDPDLPTGSAFVRYRNDGSRDFVFNIAASAAGQIVWSDEVEALAERAGHLHVMGSALSVPSVRTVITRALPLVVRRGGTVSLDPNLRKELDYDGETRQRFAELVAQSDVLLPSGDELALVAGVNDEQTAVDRLLELGVGEIVVKRGTDGATGYLSDGSRYDATAFEIDELDPTGAGDCFGGAYVASRRLGLAVDEALTYACAAGARNAAFVGPMEGAGTRAELDGFIASTPRRS